MTSTFGTSLAHAHAVAEADALPRFPVRTHPQPVLLREVLRAPLHLAHPVALHMFRHGETTHNSRGLISGTLDVALTERGREQARALGGRLAASYDLAICSELSRSRETLELALTAGGVRVHNLFSDFRLNERCLGELEGQPARSLEAYRRGDLGYAPPGGDSYAVVAFRVLAFLIDLAGWVEEHGVRSVALSTHMGAMRALAAVLEEQRDAAAMMARCFDNSHVLVEDWRAVSWPPFLSPGHV